MYINKSYEKSRQEFICNELQCYYHIIEPDSPIFSIPNMIRDFFNNKKLIKQNINNKIICNVNSVTYNFN